MPVNNIDFIIYYLPHATNGRTYYCDAILRIKGEDIYTDECFEPEDIERSNKKMQFYVKGYGKLDGRYTIIVEEGKDIIVTRTLGDSTEEYVVNKANYTCDYYRWSVESDDPVWEALGYN